MTVWNLGDHIAFQRPDVAACTNLARLLVRTSSCDFGDSINASQCNKLILGRQAGPPPTLGGSGRAVRKHNGCFFAAPRTFPTCSQTFLRCLRNCRKALSGLLDLRVGECVCSWSGVQVSG